jgi:signal transduction histidine kinase
MVEEYDAEITVPTSWPTVLGYSPWVEEIWVNYLSNAIKYGGPNSRLELGADEQDDGMIRFWIKDNGPGISPEHQAKVFEPHERLDQLHINGTGLGLSIVKRIVEKCNGEVGVDSEPGHGSQFWFTLPAANVNPETSHKRDVVNAAT